MVGGGPAGPGQQKSLPLAERTRSAVWHHRLMGSADITDTARHEAREIDEVIARLQERFPSIEVGRIRDIVAEEHQQFVGRPIRDFVPVFVERSAIQRLR